LHLINGYFPPTGTVFTYQFATELVFPTIVGLP
jgi:hypothetical protein